MTPRRAQAVTILLGVVFLAVAAIMLVVVPADAVGALRWGIGLPFLVIGLANLALAPRFSREVLPDDGQFQPLDAQGRPVVGSPHVQQLARALPLGLCALMTPAWFIVLRTHSIQHGWFTWRALGLTVFAGLAFLYYCCDVRQIAKRLKRT